MGEFDQYDGQNNFNERRRRRNRRLSSEDDAYGMADAGDRADGDFANMEDYAGGLVEEEGRNSRYYREWDDQSQADPLADPTPTASPRYRRPGAPVPPLDPNQPSPAVQRAAQLMERANRRNRGLTIDDPPPRRGRSRADDYDETPEQQPLGGFMDMLGSLGRNLNIPGLPTVDASGIGNASKSIMVALLVVAFLLCSCLLLLTFWIISLFAS